MPKHKHPSGDHPRFAPVWPVGLQSLAEHLATSYTSLVAAKVATPPLVERTLQEFLTRHSNIVAGWVVLREDGAVCVSASQKRNGSRLESLDATMVPTNASVEWVSYIEPTLARLPQGELPVAGIAMPIRRNGACIGHIGLLTLTGEQCVSGGIRLTPRRTKAQEAIDTLTRREKEVMQLLCQGLTNDEIARTLGVSPHTIKNHLMNIFQKLRVANRVEAVTALLEATSGTATN
jgi:Response regulator containing a CheY-like receiver domain and an HTH DNA-binding domain